MGSDRVPAALYKRAYWAKHQWIEGEQVRLKARRDAAMGFLIVALLAASTTLGVVGGNSAEARSCKCLAWAGLSLVLLGVLAAFGGAVSMTRGRRIFPTPNPRNYLQYSSVKEMYRESVVDYDPEDLTRKVTEHCRGLIWSQAGALVVILGAVLIWIDYLLA